MSEDQKAKTGCVCPNAGFCSRHQVNKTPHLHKLCQNHQPTFDKWEACQGPGQQNINCNKIESFPVEKVEVEQVSSPPSLIKQAGSFIKAATKHVVSGAAHVSQEKQEERLSICAACPKFDSVKNKCLACGCNLAIKTKWATSKCPLGHW